jgi:hypothetical protein
VAESGTTAFKLENLENLESCRSLYSGLPGSLTSLILSPSAALKFQTVS